MLPFPKLPFLLTLSSNHRKQKRVPSSFPAMIVLGFLGCYVLVTLGSW